MLSSIHGWRLHHLGLGEQTLQGWSRSSIMEISVFSGKSRGVTGRHSHCVAADFMHIIIDGDNAVVIQALARKIAIPWLIVFIIRDISSCLIMMDYFSISHKFIEANMTAYRLSTLGHTLSLATTWHHPPPLEFRDIVFLTRW